MEYLHKGDDFSKIKAGSVCTDFMQNEPFQVRPNDCNVDEGIGYGGGGCYNYCAPTINVPPCTELY